MDAFTTVYWGSTQVDTTSGDWARTVKEIDLGMAEYEQYTSPSPWLGGDVEVAAPRVTGRKFALYIDSDFDGSAASADGAARDEMQFLSALFTPGSLALTELKTTRPNTAGGSVARSIWCRCIAAHPFGYSGGGDESGIRRNWPARIRYRVDLYAPFPLWQDTTATVVTAATGDATKTCAVTGEVAVGVKVIVTAVTACTALALSNDLNAFAVTMTSPSTSTILDFNYTDPALMAFTSATINALGYLRLEMGNNVITKGVTGTSAACSFTYRNAWFTP